MAPATLGYRDWLEPICRPSPPAGRRLPATFAGRRSTELPGPGLFWGQVVFAINSPRKRAPAHFSVEHSSLFQQLTGQGPSAARGPLPGMGETVAIRSQSLYENCFERPHCTPSWYPSLGCFHSPPAIFPEFLPFEGYDPLFVSLTLKASKSRI